MSERIRSRVKERKDTNFWFFFWYLMIRMEKDSKRSKPINTQIDDPLDNDARILTCLKLYTSLNN